MQARNPAEITVLLERMRSGDPGAVDRAMEVLYPEPRKLAHGTVPARTSGRPYVTADRIGA